jgi:general nucleoside transport system permease protein
MSFLNELLIPVVASTFRVSTPLLFAALGGLFSERSGVINIALEGLMLMGAFAAASVTLAGMGAGAAFAAVYGLFVIRLRSNQIVAGTAMNMAAVGLTPFLGKILYGSTTSTPAVPIEARFQAAPLWLAYLLAVLVWIWLARTPSGLWVRFAGEKPEALDSAGVRVNRVRWASVLMSGALAGMGGAALSIYLSSSFSRNMTAGRGFMALAALIFGSWRPLPTAAACLLFGFADALQIRLQGVILWGTEPVPVQFVQILPYVATILVLAGVVGQSRAPRALGIPYTKG